MQDPSKASVTSSTSSWPFNSKAICSDQNDTVLIISTPILHKFMDGILANVKDQVSKYHLRAYNQIKLKVGLLRSSGQI